MQAGGEFTGI